VNGGVGRLIDDTQLSVEFNDLKAVRLEHTTVLPAVQ
jgi:hypothetical protein